MYVDTVQRFAEMDALQAVGSRDPVGVMIAAARAGISVGFGIPTAIISHPAE